MPLRKAQIAEIMRSGQKDLEYVSSVLLNLIKGASNSCIKLYYVFKESDNLSEMYMPESIINLCELCSRVVYGLLTTGIGNQTLGEEYVNIIEVDGSRRRHPSFPARVFMVILHTVLPTVIEKLLQTAKNSLKNANWTVESKRLTVMTAIDRISAIMTLCYRMHRSFFFLGLASENLAKTATSIGYVAIRNKETTPFRALEGLGYLGVIQCLITAITSVTSLRKLVSDETSYCSSSTITRSKLAGRQCPLCLQNYDNATCTPCGHVFCWKCIQPWTTANSVCPICRESCSCKSLVLLANFC